MGRYLVEQLIDNNERNDQYASEYRALGDSPAAGVVMYPNGGFWEMVPAPEIDAEKNYHQSGKHRPIRVYSTFDVRFLIEDFFAKRARFIRKAD